MLTSKQSALESKFAPFGNPKRFSPTESDSSHRFAQYRGQRQKWFAAKFTGDDADVDPLTPRNGQPAEFDAWRWERLDRVADLVVPFRREVYRAVAESFAKFV